MSDGLEKYRVKPNQNFKLKSCDSSDKSLFEGITKEDGYEEAFEDLQRELQELQKVLFAEGKKRILVVIQAMDTGGKDGCIKHVFSRIDPQGIRVKAFKKPSADELAHDFLWRVHAEAPGNGEIVIFNRSHYEDILAVRVKKIFGDEVWKRRYQHIVDFERMLAEEGTTIVKIFLNISKEEQKSRLVSRLENPDKHWKFFPDDVEDRARWDEFMVAYEDLFRKTSTDYAPWYVIPADRKWYRNLVVAELMVKILKGLKMKYPKPTWNADEIEIGD